MKQFSPQIMKWVIKLLLFLIVISGVTYLFYLNPDNAVFRFTSQRQFSAPLALIVLLAFGAGIIITAVVAILVGMHQKFLSWGMIRKLENYEHIKSNYIKARSLLAVENFGKAEKAIKKILDHDGAHVPSNVLLANIREQEGELAEAIEIIDKLVLANQSNAELVLYLVKLHSSAGNDALAYERLKALFKLYPKSKKVLSLLLEFSERLKDTASATEYRGRLLSVSTAKEVKALEEKAFSLCL